MQKKTGILVSIICFLVGFILGLFLSPIKQGIGNHCGNTNHYYGKDGKKEANTDQT